MIQKRGDKSETREARMTDSNIDLHTVDVLLNKADELLSRHKKPAPREEEDIPVLTDIDDDTQVEMIEAESLPPFAADDEDYLFKPTPPAAIAPQREAGGQTPAVTPPPAITPPSAITPPPVATPPPENTATQVDMTPILEQLIDLETTISRQIENWFAAELSQLIEHELNQASLRLREQVFAQMRTTLQPKISEQISEHLAQIFTQDKS